MEPYGTFIWRFDGQALPSLIILIPSWPIKKVFI